MNTTTATRWTSPAAAATPAAAVALRQVTMTYPGNVCALADVNLEIPFGQHVVILGSSGCGKSTLLGCISGRLNASAGQVQRAGRIATIYQDLRLVNQRTALQNVLHGSLGRQPWYRGIIGAPASERERAKDLLARVGLAHRMHARVGRLSGGEAQRVAIARALMQDPAVLLADEPVAALDAANAHAIMRLLNDLRLETGLTLITVLHDCHLAEAYADRIIGLQDGKLVHESCAGERPAEASGTSFRGFRRFEPCGACQAIGISPSSSTPAAAEDKPPARRPWAYAALAVAALAAYAWAFYSIELTGRETDGLLENLAGFIRRMIPTGEQMAMIEWRELASSLNKTFQMTLLGTTAAVLVALPMAALAARNVAPRLIGVPMRMLLNVIRAVPSIIWALLFVAIAGIGEVAGILALVAYSLGYLTKFFYEAFEGAQAGPQEALREIGASGPVRFWQAVWPASLPAILSSCVFMLEYNVRAASVLGVVGAGGIGYDLKLHIDYGNYHVVGAIILILVAVVLILDALSSRLRAWLLRP